jgi:hypothetical protein
MDSANRAKKTHTQDPPPAGEHSLEFLIQQVEEFQRTSQLDTIERLTIENSLLHNLLVRYKKSWAQTIDMLEQTQQALRILLLALEHCVSEEIAAERDWLAFWGIDQNTDNTIGGQI